MAAKNNKKSKHSVVWFRNDLRITDNPALYSACKNSEKVSAIFFIAEKQWKNHDWSDRRIHLTFLALKDLWLSLNQLGIQLFVLPLNDFKKVQTPLKKFLVDEDIDTLYFNAEYALDEKNRDRTIEKICEKNDIRTHITHGSVIIPPSSVRTQQGMPYKVFTPFKREWVKTLPTFDRNPLSKPKAVDKSQAESLTTKTKKHSDFKALNKRIEDFVSTLDKHDLYYDAQHGTEAFAQKQLKAFIDQKISDYHEQRDLPAIDGTSSLSPALTVGLISPRSCLHAARSVNEGHLTDFQKGADTWISEIIWREFYCHLLADFPAISYNKPLKPETDSVPWRHNKKEFTAWYEGKTGYPLIDAAMRQLNQTGWMHNRLRMVTATFLTKYLLIDWRLGEQYFMQTLYDGHFASNNGGWQWSASTGTDAAPYFRILSPVRQAERFDNDCEFIKRYVPELADCPPKSIHKPGHEDLLAAGYSKPIVDLKMGKDRCLEAFKFALN